MTSQKVHEWVLFKVEYHEAKLEKKNTRNNPYIKINVQSTDIISGSLFSLLQLLLFCLLNGTY